MTITSAVCACSRAPGLYVEIGAGAKLEGSTSYVLRPQCHTVRADDGGIRSCGGDNPTAYFNVGWQFKRDAWLDRCELAHSSHFFDGGRDRETHVDTLRCFKRFGGRDARR